MFTTVPTPHSSVASEWFVSWFDSVHYHRLYAHRDSHEAARFMDRLIEELEPPPGASMLDVGCGAGRHATHLASRGFDVTGIDLSASSIQQAKLNERGNLRFLRQDMRLPFRVAPVDYILSLFTSFGYFEDPAEHLTVVSNMATVLKRGGCLVLDFLNVRHVETHLMREEEIEMEDAVYRISRWTTRDSIFKRIQVHDAAASQSLEFFERVSKLTLHDFQFMCALCGMTVDRAYGDYQLGPFDVESSPRLILVARKS
jgi:SAM-dependent methyltransferase